MALFCEAQVSHGRPLLADFEADEPGVRSRQRALKEKTSLRPRPDLELELCGGDQTAQIDRFTRREAGRIVVGAGLARPG
jgi:hypothetical protein